MDYGDCASGTKNDAWPSNFLARSNNYLQRLNMPLLVHTPTAQLDDLLETLWNLEDIHRELVERVNRLIARLEEPTLIHSPSP